MECRIVGVITAIQRNKKQKAFRNDRFIGIPSASVVFRHVNSIRDFSKEMLQQLDNFFIEYNREEGRSFKIINRLNGAKAIKLYRKR